MGLFCVAWALAASDRARLTFVHRCVSGLGGAEDRCDSLPRMESALGCQRNGTGATRNVQGMLARSSRGLDQGLCSALQGILGCSTYLEVPRVTQGELLGSMFAVTHREHLTEHDRKVPAILVDDAETDIATALLFHRAETGRREPAGTPFRTS